MPRLGRSEHHDVDLQYNRTPVDDPDPTSPKGPPQNARMGRDRECAADRLEMRSYHLRQETRPGSGPDRWRITEFEARPFPAHDGLIEGYERLGYAVPSPPRPEQVGLFYQQAAILEHTERMRYLVGFPADVAGDPARGVVSLGDGGQHRMVQRRVAYLGLLGQQVTGFPEERGLRIQYGPDHPRIKVVKVRGGVFPYEFPPVRGSSAHQRMHEHGQLRVGDSRTVRHPGSRRDGRPAQDLPIPATAPIRKAGRPLPTWRSRRGAVVPCSLTRFPRAELALDDRRQGG